MSIKKLIQTKLHNKCVEDYEKLLQQEKEQLCNAYQTLCNKREKEPEWKEYIPFLNGVQTYGKFNVIPMENCNQNFVLENVEAKYLIFIGGSGCITRTAFEIIEKCFAENEEITVIYSHEDKILLPSKCPEIIRKRNDNWSDKNIRRDDVFFRYEPWIKPVWSPDSLLSYFYLGNMIAVRTQDFLKTKWLGNTYYLKNIYDVILQLTIESDRRAFLIDAVLYHKHEYKELSYEQMLMTIEKIATDPERNILGNNKELLGTSKEYADIKIRAYKSYQKKAYATEDNFGICHIYPEVGGGKVSILIPTKDHPEVLARNISSIREKTKYINYEIIVIDNGSNEENQKAYMELSKKYDFSYFYESMDFNYSKMNNLAASKAKGDFYLLLNDDMEIIQENWLEKMLAVADLPHVGAVGAKLYYPNSKKIQHVGITNLTEGPVHKLQGEDDCISYYYGVNRVNRDIIGVTAACLMIAKSKFEEVDGLFEGLAVAYNDVDLNFKLREKGYYNVILNDVILYHHESLSRGDDMASKTKLQRLKKENHTLYERNPFVYATDEFYGSFMTGVSNRYEISYPFENKNLEPILRLKSVSKKDKEILLKNDSNLFRNAALIISVDHAEMDRMLWTYKEKCDDNLILENCQKKVKSSENIKTYLIDLHAHIRGLDSADYNYQIFLKGKNNVYEIPFIRRYREDVAKNLYNELHVELSGFAARIPIDLLEEKSYEIWIKASNRCSRQVLWNKAEVCLQG